MAIVRRLFHDAVSEISEAKGITCRSVHRIQDHFSSFFATILEDSHSLPSRSSMSGGLDWALLKPPLDTPCPCRGAHSSLTRVRDRVFGHATSRTLFTYVPNLGVRAHVSAFTLHAQPSSYECLRRYYFPAGRSLCSNSRNVSLPLARILAGDA